MCLGFLPHNFFPARIFMGDSGSMLIGLILAASTSASPARSTSARSTRRTCSRRCCRCCCRSLPSRRPFLDMLLAVVRRTRAGRSLFAPDKQHLHHRLLQIGHSHRRAVLIMYFWSALIAWGVLGLSLLGVALWALLAVVVLVVVGLLLLRGPLRATPVEEPPPAPLSGHVQM